MSTDPSDSLAPAGNPDPVVERKADEVSEITPVVMWDKPSLGQTPDDLYDFRPRNELEDAELEVDTRDPKDSSAAVSALAEIYETVKTPPVVYKESQENPASADTEDGSLNPSENGGQTSSPTPETSNGKTEQPA